MKRETLLAVLAAVLLLLPRAFAAQPRKVGAPKQTGAATARDDEDDNDDDDDEDVAAHPDGSRTGGSAKVAIGARTNADDGDDDDDDEDDDSPDPTEISANVALTSNYMLRGLTQTENQPAIQGGFDWNHPLGFDLSAWGTNVRFPESPTSVELDFSGGYTRVFPGEISVRLGGLYYWYIDDSPRDSWDIQSSAEWRGFKVEVDFSPSWEGTNEHSWYFNAGWSDELLWGLKPGFFAGYSMYPQGSFFPSYFDFKVSLAREFMGLTWEAAGVFTKVQRLIQSETIIDPEDEELTISKTTQTVYGGSRAVFTVSKSF